MSLCVEDNFHEVVLSFHSRLQVTGFHGKHLCAIFWLFFKFSFSSMRWG